MVKNLYPLQINIELKHNTFNCEGTEVECENVFSIFDNLLDKGGCGKSGLNLVSVLEFLFTFTALFIGGRCFKSCFMVRVLDNSIVVVPVVKELNLFPTGNFENDSAVIAAFLALALSHSIYFILYFAKSSRNSYKSLHFNIITLSTNQII